MQMPDKKAALQALRDHKLALEKELEGTNRAILHLVGRDKYVVAEEGHDSPKQINGLSEYQHKIYLQVVDFIKDKKDVEMQIVTEHIVALNRDKRRESLRKVIHSLEGKGKVVFSGSNKNNLFVNLITPGDLKWSENEQKVLDVAKEKSKLDSKIAKATIVHEVTIKNNTLTQDNVLNIIKSVVKKGGLHSLEKGYVSLAV